MKVTRIRIGEGTKKPTTKELLNIKTLLCIGFKGAGFITEVSIVNSTSIRIGLHMKSFVLDLTKHHRNLYRSRFGENLTSLPTWKQRVGFNEIVNDVLNDLKVSALVRSDVFDIRNGMHCFDEYDWNHQLINSPYRNQNTEIIEIDENEYLDEKRRARNLKAREKRKELKCKNIENTVPLSQVKQQSSVSRPKLKLIVGGRYDF